MTTISFYKHNDEYFGFRMSGHAGFNDKGDDILCASLSAMTMLIVNTVEICFSGEVEYAVEDDVATITVRSIHALAEFEGNPAIRYAISGVFMGYMIQLSDMALQYPQNLFVEEVNCKGYEDVIIAEQATE